MAIVKTNTYGADSNLDNVSDNIKYTSLGNDKIDIIINNSVLPATITVLKGSIFEYGGNNFLVFSDTEIKMTNSSDNFLAFDGSSFLSSSTTGTWDTEKRGYYNGDNRILKFYIDQVGGSFLDLVNLKTNLTPLTKKFDRCRVDLTSNYSSVVGVIPFNNIVFDELSSFDTVNYRFVAPESGYYLINVSIDSIGSSLGGVVYVDIRKNGSGSLCEIANRFSRQISTSSYITAKSETIEYLQKDDYIDVYNKAAWTSEVIQADATATYFEVTRLL